MGDESQGIKIEVQGVPKGYERICEDISRELKIKFEKSRPVGLWKIIKQIFVTSIIKIGEFRERPVSKIPDDFSTEKYASATDGSGKDLALFLHSLKEKDDDRLQKIKEKFEDIFDGYTFDTIREEGYKPYIPEKETLGNQNLKIVEVDKNEVKIIIKNNKKKILLEDVGSGVFEILNLIATLYDAKNKVILLDEPTLHIHPRFQKEVGDYLYDNSTENQIILITHSPYMINIDKTNKLYRFILNDGGETEIRSIINCLKNHKLGKDLERKPIISSLFANKVLLVEGDSEYLTVPILAEKLGYPLNYWNVEIIPVSGKEGFKKYIKLMKCIGIDFGIVCDGDTFKSHKKIFKNLPNNQIFACKQKDWDYYIEDSLQKKRKKKLETVLNLVRKLPNNTSFFPDFKAFIEEFIDIHKNSNRLIN